MAEAPDLGPFVERADVPVYIVTAFDGDERSGCLIGFAGQCSIDPVRFTAWISKANHTFGVAQGSEELAVHLIPATDTGRAVAELFAEESGDWTDKFDRCTWEPGPGGVPLLAACPDRFVGRVVDRYDGGDHVAHVLEPSRVDTVPAGTDVLRFGDVAGFTPGHPA